MSVPNGDGSPEKKAADLIDSLGRALADGDADAAAAHFAPDSHWRDLVSFTWNIKTMEGPAQVRDMLSSQLAAVRPRGLRVAKGEPPTESDDGSGTVEAWIDFETEAARCRGHLRLRGGRVWTLLTASEELIGFEEPLGARRPAGVGGRRTWAEERDAEAAELGITREPYCVIVGGGQGGVALGARLRQLSVPTVVIDRHERPGGAWRERYKTLCLHDPVWYDHMPYLPFPPNWPVFSPKDRIADWLEMYAKVMEVNYWGSTTCKSARYDDDAGEWEVVVERGGAEITLRPKQLVLATGMLGKPHTPQFKGMDRFGGEQHHSSAHTGPDGYEGKRAVVIGSGTSAHDICAALWEAGADVTMVQRSSTCVVKSDTLTEMALGDFYSERAEAAGMTTDRADLTFASIPYRVLANLQVPLYAAMREKDRDFYDRLEGAGFLTDWGDDDSGLFMKYLRTGAGYYIDFGASELIAGGKIKLRSGEEVSEITEDAVVLADGAKLPADLIVYATGYGGMNRWARDLISREVAERVGRVWGLGSGTKNDPGPWEGEERNMWKPTRQKGLWFHGGNLHQSRHYSHFLALQIKARMEGIDMLVYGLQEVHHLS